MDGQYFFFFAQLSFIPITFIIGRQLKGLLSNILQNDNKTKAHISNVYFPGSQNLVGFNVILLRGVCAFNCSAMSNHLQSHGSYVDCKALLSIEFPRQQYWSGLPFPPPGDPSTGIKSVSCIVGRSFTTQPPGKPTAQRYDNLILSNDSSLQALGSGAMIGYVTAGSISLIS